ncbi:uncharacterized protein [Amphiura filiformis]|uniref:uncharacterized protein n=1 Tax=Amphiura filiformis TaxID=82378 RepID=UPI003B21A696
MNSSNGKENGQTVQFEEDVSNMIFRDVTITQYKSMQRQTRLMVFICVTSILLLVGISAGLVTIHITNTNVRRDLERTKLKLNNLNSTFVNGKQNIGQGASSVGNFQAFSSSDNKGTVYTRWGNSSCPESAELVYDGLVGGSLYSQVGGAAQYLCLPQDPIYGHVNPVVHEYRSIIYHTELQFPGFTILEHLQHADAACSVCRTLGGRVSVLMLPAKNKCPSGWTQEYDGFLMTSSQDHRRTEYLCVDSNPTPLRGGVQDINGALLYPVEATCETSNIPCPPYVAGHELTCAVCSK